MASDAVLQLTDDNFEAEVIKSKIPVLVDFWAEWCMPCRMIGPFIDELARTYNGKIKVGKLDTDANQATAVNFRIMSIPAVMLFKDGQVVAQIVGARPSAKALATDLKIDQFVAP